MLKELYEEETKLKWWWHPVLHGDLGVCSDPYMKWLEQKVEAGDNLQCCGNCSHTNDDFECSFELPMTRCSNSCDKWQSDGMTRKERVSD